MLRKITNTKQRSKRTLTERWGFFVLSNSDSQMVQVGFCLEKRCITDKDNPDKNAEQRQGCQVCLTYKESRQNLLWGTHNSDCG